MYFDSYNNVKYYFQHPTLTKIPGTPTYKNLINLQKEVRASSKSVPCNLGGGNQGHLVLVTFNKTYARINPASILERPIHPVPLYDISKATQYQIAETFHIHNETLLIFNMCNIVK